MAFFRPPYPPCQTHFFVSSHQLSLAIKKPPKKGWLFNGRGSKIGLIFCKKKSSSLRRICLKAPAFFRPPYPPCQTHFFVSSHQLLLAIKKPPMKGWLFNGRGSKIRTHDTRFWRPMLYQLSYTPILKWWAIRDSNPGPTGYEPVALTN